MPYTINMRYVDKFIERISAKSYRLIGDYCLECYKIIRNYNGAYWSLRYSQMQGASTKKRKQNQ